MIIQCEQCGVSLKSRGTRHRFCSLCIKARRAQQMRDWQEVNRERRREYMKQGPWNLDTILRRYGLTREEYQELIESQNGVCAICSNPPPDGKRLSVDHCHKTGKVRGLLCTGCNLGIGNLGDNVQGVARALIYLLLRSP